MLWIPDFRPKENKNCVDWLMLPFTLAISGIAYFCLAFVLFFVWPVTVPEALFRRWSDARRVRKARQAWIDRGRVMDWDEIERRLKKGEGSLIFSELAGMASKGSDGVWWTPEVPDTMDPATFFYSYESYRAVGGLAAPDEFISHHFVPTSSFKAFADRYLNPLHGSSMLAQGAESTHGMDALFRYCRTQFEIIPLVMVGPPPSRRAEYAQEFEGMCRWVWISPAICCAFSLAGLTDFASMFSPTLLFLALPHFLGVGLAFWAGRRHPLLA